MRKKTAHAEKSSSVWIDARQKEETQNVYQQTLIFYFHFEN